MQGTGFLDGILTNCGILILGASSKEKQGFYDVKSVCLTAILWLEVFLIVHCLTAWGTDSEQTHLDELPSVQLVLKSCYIYFENKCYDFVTVLLVLWFNF